MGSPAWDCPSILYKLSKLPRSLVQLRSCRDMVIHHQQIQLLLAILFAHSRQQHTAGINSHHGSRRKIRNRNQRLANQLFRLVEHMNTAQNGAVCAGSVIQCKLQQLLALRNSNALLDLNCSEIRLAEGLKVYLFFK